VTELADLSGKTLVTYVADLLYSPVLDYFSGLEKYTARRFECASVVAQAEAVRAGIGIGVLHDYAVRSFPELQVVLPDISYLRTYWLVTHADVRSLRRVEEVYSFILSRVRANRGLFV
jgi:DNA-binding transcriptional LysR family regulator